MLTIVFLVMEATTERFRPLFSLILMTSYGIGVFINVACGYFIRSFRYLILIQLVAVCFTLIATLM